MSAHQKFPLRDAQDVTGLVLSLPVTSQLTIALEIIRGRDLFRMDGDELDRAECALSSLLSEAREAAYSDDGRQDADQFRAAAFHGHPL